MMPFKKSFLLTALLASFYLTSSEASATSILHQLFGHTSDDQGVREQGIVVADEAQASLAGRLTLLRGGNAVDAATSVALALSVTLPSRASLGGGGACLVTLPTGESKAYSFLPQDAGSPPNGFKPASLPMMLRGLFLMQSDAGQADFKLDIDPARKLAQDGMVVSNQLAHDMAAVGPALFNDSQMRNTFAYSDGRQARTNDEIHQPLLGSFLEQIERLGVGDLYIGALGDEYAREAKAQSIFIDRTKLHNATPSKGPALNLPLGNGVTIQTLPAPADGGLLVAMLAHNESNPQGLLQQWRNQTKDAVVSSATELSFLSQAKSVPNSTLPELPASTSFVVEDAKGLSVGCSLSDGNLFGTGKTAGMTGIVIGASPKRYPMPLYTVVHTHNNANNITVAASGQSSAAQYAWSALQSALSGELTRTTNGKFNGGSNAISCKNNDRNSCQAQSGTASGLVAQTPLYQH